MNSKDSLMFRMEKTRVFLEKQIGLETLLQIYQRIVQEGIEEGEIQKLLNG